jgi:ribokinase
MDTIEHLAENHDGFFCLNAAPAREVSEAVLRHTDLLVVNEIEARAIGDNLKYFKGLLATTFGSKGASISCEGTELATAIPPEIIAVDTTGAGDAFTAALTVALVSGMGAQNALNLACQAGALTATRAGAQGSPRLEELKF